LRFACGAPQHTETQSSAGKKTEEIVDACEILGVKLLRLKTYAENYREMTRRKNW